MKKTLSIMLAIAVLLSCMTVTVFAKEQNSKITSALAEKLEKLAEGEKIEACIWLYYIHDAELIERKTYEECGLTAGTCMTLEEVHIYKKAYNRIAGELEAAGNKAFIEKTGVTDEDVVYCGTLAPLVALKLSKDQIYAISAYKEVQILDYDETVLADELSGSGLPYEATGNGDSDYHYINSFKKKYETQYEKTSYYRELYFHCDESNCIDWALICCKLDVVEPMPYNAVIGNRVIQHSSQNLPFNSSFAVYDVKEDRFINAASIEAKNYPGFGRAFEENVTEGRLLGDIDRDDELTIIDATLIQRCDVKLRDWPEDDAMKAEIYSSPKLKYYSDFDRDGERNVVDATLLQRYVTMID